MATEEPRAPGTGARPPSPLPSASSSHAGAPCEASPFMSHLHLCQGRGTLGSKLLKNLIFSDESVFVWSLLPYSTRGVSLAVLWFRMCALNPGAAGVIPGQGTTILHSVGGKIVQDGNQDWSGVAAGNGTLGVH